MHDELHAVRTVRWFGRDVFELTLERGDYPFVPGDCAALFGADGRVSRPYSLASGNIEDTLRFLIRQMPGGEVSPYLAARKPGDQVRVSPPFGWFRPGATPGGAPFAFLATGTGIAPFLSYLRSAPMVRPTALFHGVRHGAERIEPEWLIKESGAVIAVSREVTPGCHHGRITGLLDRLPVDERHHYYLCGLDAMIDEVTGWLEDHGVDIARIHRECFFNASYGH